MEIIYPHIHWLISIWNKVVADDRSNSISVNRINESGFYRNPDEDSPDKGPVMRSFDFLASKSVK